MMSTEVARPAGKVKLTVDEYKTIIDTGVFEGRHVQLLDGELFEVTKNSTARFHGVRPGRTIAHDPDPRGGGSVREEKTIEPWPFWWPEPDIAVARGPHRRYEDRHPGPRDIVLLVEVCDTSQYEDRVKKPPAYARIGCASTGSSISTEGSWRSTRIRSGWPPAAISRTERDTTKNGRIPVVIEGRKYRAIPVADILPSQQRRTDNRED